MEFEPGRVNDFLELFTSTRPKIAGFEGCISLQLLNDIQSANVFFTYSTWQSEKALENYRNSDLFKQTWTKTKAMFSSKAQAWSVKQVEIKN